MKFYRKRKMVSLVLALALSSTSILPVFAEGTKEVNSIPSNATDAMLEANPAYRAYFDWRDRTEFDMPCENVIYAYANAGETIYFGSNVTSANDRSIQAIVEPGIGFSDSLSSNGKDWAGSSIAVTLPSADDPTKAFDPKSMDVSNFAVGSSLETEKAQNKVYLFKPTPSGTGHIANVTQEKNGPTGVDGTGNEGYQPLSFVAPITGTYSFRFLSSQYIQSDQPQAEKMDTSKYVYYGSIDFDGMNGEPVIVENVSEVKYDRSYYEPEFGKVIFKYINSNKNDRAVLINQLTDSDSITVPATDLHSEVTYSAGKKYAYASKQAVKDGASITFTPLHDDVVIEVVWARDVLEATDERKLSIAQGDKEASVKSTASGVNVTTFSAVKGNSIKAGEPVTIWLSSGRIYEIRYYHNRTSSIKSTPAPIEYEKSMVFDAYKEDTNISTDTKILDDPIDVWYYPNSRTGKGGPRVKEVPVELKDGNGNIVLNKTYNTYLNLPSNSNNGVELKITPKHDNSWIEVVWGQWEVGYSSELNYKISDTNTGLFEKKYTGAASHTGATSQDNKSLETYSSTLTGLKSNEPITMYLDKGGYIYEIIYHYEDPFPWNDETSTTSGISLMSYVENEVTQPSTVSESYTWDLYQLKGADGITKYISNAILGDNSYVDGKDNTDCDSVYDWDVKVYATNDKPVNINNQSLWLYNAGVFNSEGTPQSGVLELTPEYNGSVEAVFGYGAIEIKQGDKTNTSASDNGIQTSVTLDVAADQPVYIYSTHSSYLKAIKYTVDTSDLEGLARKVDQQWCNTTGSLVASWDVTVAENNGSKTYYPINEFTSTKLAGPGELTSADGKLKVQRGGNYGSDTRTFNDLGVVDDTNGKSTTSFKLNNYKNGGSSNYFEYTPDQDGTIEVTGYTGSKDWGNTVIYIVQNDKTVGQGKENDRYKLEKITAKVEANKSVKIFVSQDGSGNGGKASAYFHKIKFTPNESGAASIKGRVWTDILFMNAGGYKKSLYTKLNILTDEGFLYDLWWNGVQPYSMAFYSNNRGFLLDRWSLYSNPSLAGVEKNTKQLQPLEHYFYSYTDKNDVGDAPVHIETDGGGNPLIYNGNVMKSAINGNYIPVDSQKDATHMIFFNVPDEDAMKAYTGSATMMEISTDTSDYNKVLEGITYTGLGNAANNSGDVHYGTIGIGGEFTININDDKLNALSKLGSNTVSITLDFSGYKLNSNKAPVLDDNGKWQENGTTKTDAEKNNIVTLSTTIDNTKTGTYKLTWNGRDAYGNAVPQGEYSKNVKSFVEVGTAHFPMLDAEHNPNGFKVALKNSLNKDGAKNEQSTYLYYNNEAISPKTDETASSAWYFTGRDNLSVYPAQIGDGKNMLAGVDTSVNGAMAFGEYDESLEGDTLEAVYSGLNKKKEGGDGGYGNYAAIDMWSKYELGSGSDISIGVNPIVTLRPYVSFVATDGKVDNGQLPFKVSHIGYNMELIEENANNIGSSTSTDTNNKEKYGNTISTGFIASVTTNENQSQNYVVWDISIPTFGQKVTSSTQTTDVSTYIKIPNSDKESFTTQEEADEAEYLAYEIYSGLFEGIPTDSDDGTYVGDEEFPDWEADASLNDGNSDTDIAGTANGAESGDANVSEESIMTISELSEGTKAGDYTRSNWNTTLNLSTEATLTDKDDVAVNKGEIYKVEQIGGDKSKVANVKIRYKLPTTITGASTIKLGIVIDNLYAPGATASVYYRDNTLDGFSDITSILFDSSFSNMGTNKDTVQSTSFNNYATSKLNDYYTKNEGDVSLEIDYKMDFSSNDTTINVGGAEITKTRATYSLFDGEIEFKNAYKHNSNHGLVVYGPIEVKVPGPVKIELGGCAYSAANNMTLTDSNGNGYGSQIVKGKQTDGGKVECKENIVFNYTGNAPTTLTLTLDQGFIYLPFMNVVSTN